MGASDKDGTDRTVVALPYVSKQGFTGATVASIILNMASGNMRRCQFTFFGDHTQVGARNAACRTAIELGADWLFFVDSDMDFPIGTLPRLQACDADIACTDMWSRNLPSFRTVGRFTANDSNGKRAVQPYAGTGVEEVDVCGMACTVIKVPFLKRMREKLNDLEKQEDVPWFQAARHGEDAAFCIVAKELCGAVIKCDYGITAGHWGVARMAGQDWTRDGDNNPMKPDDPEFMRRMLARNV